MNAVMIKRYTAFMLKVNFAISPHDTAILDSAAKRAGQRRGKAHGRTVDDGERGVPPSGR
jgi:hypothetical protein